MKRLLAGLLALLATGCMAMDDYGFMDDGGWYDAPAGDCGCSTGAPPAPRLSPTQVVPLGPNIIPAGGIPGPPLPPQTREPDMLR